MSRTQNIIQLHFTHCTNAGRNYKQNQFLILFAITAAFNNIQLNYSETVNSCCKQLNKKGFLIAKVDTSKSTPQSASNCTQEIEMQVILMLLNTWMSDKLR